MRNLAGNTPTPPKKQANKAVEAARLARRVRMAGAKLAGRSIAAIAREERISANWASAELNSADCRQIIIGLVNSQFSLTERLFSRSLTAIDEALVAQRVGLSNGLVVAMGADHYARLAAVKRFLEIILAGRPASKLPEDAPGEKTCTLEMLESWFGKQHVE
jgi:hypothetical protein